MISFFQKNSFALMLVVCGLFCLLGTPPGWAQSRIVALVNDEPVTSYELDQRARFLQLISGRQSRSRALDELIEEKLKLQEALRRGVSVSLQEVEAEFANIASRTKMNASQLSQALSQSGVNPITLKNRIKAELAWGQVVRLRFRQSVRIDDAELVASMRERDQEEQSLREYTFKQVIFVLPRGANNAEEAARKRAAEAFRPTIAGCDALEGQTAGMRDVVVKSAGRHDETQLLPQSRELLEDIEVSQGTKPMRTAQGYQILVLCDMREVAGEAALRNEVRSEMMDEQGRLLARRYIRDLKQDAIIEMR